MRQYDGDSHVNVGTGEEIGIRQLAALIGEIVHPGAALAFDASKPDGMPRKRLDVDLLHRLGWIHQIGLREGLASTYDWFLRNFDRAMGERRPRLIPAPPHRQARAS
jgi:GDP-L-fucose synthase